MITLLVGHRGVGKTSLLKRIEKYVPDAECICLDEWIETKTDSSIKEIFALQGEEYFREIERESLEMIVQSGLSTAQNMYIAVGAGYKHAWPEHCRVLHVDRDVRVQDFVFLNRPSLNSDGSPGLSEQRFEQRNQQYQAADRTLLLQEGFFETNSAEEMFFTGKVFTEGLVTVFGKHFDRADWVEEKVQQGLLLESRDDLLSLEQIACMPSHLLSFREKDKINQTLELAYRFEWIDWPIEFGDIPDKLKSKNVILSLHSDAGEFADALHQLQTIDTDLEIKWSPMIQSWQELELAHNWLIDGRGRRSLLPRSTGGRWSWYRLLLKGRQRLNFIREDQGSAKDQPTTLQWLTHHKQYTEFAAILGSPVRHSWTPGFHYSFFQQQKANVLAIDVGVEELSQQTLDFLHALGLRWAAVTSPLKKKTAQLLDGAEEAVNTTQYKEDHWVGCSTDHFGFRALVEPYRNATEVIVWGGGGVIDALRTELPQAQFYSHQKQEPREGSQPVDHPEVLVWAVGRKHWEQAPHFPRLKSPPKTVVDLNYTNDSPGIAYAQLMGAKYISGEIMFIEQARRQQEYWHL